MIRTSEAPNCLLCGEKGESLYYDMEDSAFGIQGKWNLRRCQSPECNMIWLDPMPVEEDLGKLYNNYYTHATVSNSGFFIKFLMYIGSGILSTRLGYRSKEKLRNILGFIFSINRDIYDIIAGEVMWLKPVKEGRLLDIGCGNGTFLDRMRNLGWHVEGIEPDEKAVNTANKAYKLNVKHGTILTVNYPDNSFDAITMSHVIEHTPEPEKALKEIRRILKPGGNLVITTPNSHGWGQKYYKNNWEGFDIPRHLYVYNCRSLKTLVEKAGLKIREVRSSGRLEMYFLGMSQLRKKARNKNRDLSHKVLYKKMVKHIFGYMLYGSIVGSRWMKTQEEVVLIATI